MVQLAPWLKIDFTLSVSNIFTIVACIWMIARRLKAWVEALNALKVAVEGLTRETREHSTRLERGDARMGRIEERLTVHGNQIDGNTTRISKIEGRMDEWQSRSGHLEQPPTHALKGQHRAAHQG